MQTTANPPGPTSKIPGRILLSYRRDPLAFLTRLSQEYGDVAFFKSGALSYCLVNHPEYIKKILVTDHRQFMKGRALQFAKEVIGEGLLTSEGAFHHRQRRLVQPAFYHNRINSYADIMVQFTSHQQDQWQNGLEVDIDREMMQLTLSIVAKTLFNTSVVSEVEEIGAAMTIVMEAFQRMFLPFAGVVSKLPLPSNIRFRRARHRLDETIFRMIETRRGGEDMGDLLSTLLLVQDGEEESGGMTDQQVHDEVITLFIAGHETTANSLAWTWYLLSKYPDVASRFYQEIDSVLDGRLPSLSDVSNLHFTRHVITESMRLYPPAWGIGRRTLSDYPLGEYIIPEGTTVVVSQYVMHRDARYYDKPDCFIPERWEEDLDRPKYAYFPFGGGPRQCIGEQFAWMEAILIMATIAQRWHLHLVPNHPVVPKPLITLRSKFGIKMTLEQRG